MEESGALVQAAYADVDGTVVDYNTIFAMLRFDAAERGCSAEAEAFLGELRAASLAGEPRSVTNARYFTWWRERNVREVRELGERWARGGRMLKKSHLSSGAFSSRSHR